MKRFTAIIVLLLIALVSCKIQPAPTPSYPGLNKPDSSAIAESAKFEKAQKNFQNDEAVQASVNCYSEEVYKNNQVACGTEDNPVCGCNSITYKNECEAKKAGLKSFKKGKCPKEASGI